MLSGGSTGGSDTSVLSDESLPSSSLPDSTEEKKFAPESLSEALDRLEQRRAEIEADGYKPKYNDDELTQLAQSGNVGEERFQVRFMETNYLVNRDTPNEALSGAMGMTMEGASGKGAKYWSTSLDQIEDADTDPKIIAEKLGIEYNPDADYTLIIVDSEKAAPLTGVKSVPATFEEVGKFANTELPDHFSESFTSKAMTPEFQAEYAKHYEAAVEQGFLENSWSRDTDGFNDYLASTSASQESIDEMILRMQMHDKIGNNQDYLGNGLTKDISSSLNDFGAVETLNFERKEVKLSQLKDRQAITIISGLKPV